MAAKMFKVKLVKSPIGAKAEHVATVKGLGLKRMGQIRETRRRRRRVAW